MNSAILIDPKKIPPVENLVEKVMVKEGELFTLRLSANYTTGYMWELVSISDLRIIELQDHHYYPHQPVIPGSGGTDVFTFKAIRAGEAVIELAYDRPWVPEEPQLKVDVTVAKA